MLLTKTVKIRWLSTNKAYYESKGYKFTNIKDEFEVDIKDLHKNSTIEVKVQCDYCGKTLDKRYNTYNTSKIGAVVHKDACKLCSRQKQKESSQIRYGVDDPIAYFDKIRDIRKKCRQEQYSTYTKRSAKKDGYKDRKRGDGNG